jgi:regulator of protease activity HflC (stomatin/prohibitin superfamily)
MNIIQLLQVLALVALFLLVGMIVLSWLRARRKLPIKGYFFVTIILVILALGLSTAGAGLVFVEPDEVAVVITAARGGLRSEPLQPGLHWIIPFVERIETYSIVRQSYTMAAAALEGQVAGDDAVQVRTKDGQQIFIDATVIYAVDANKAVDLYITWRRDYENSLVRAQSRGIIRDVASQYNAEEIVSAKRAELEQSVTTQLTETFSKNNLILHTFLLRNIRFTDEYAAAVEQKQIAEQKAQQAMFVVETKKQEAEQARQTAQGQADAVVIAAQGEAEARVVRAEAEAKARITQAEAEAKALQMISDAIKDNPALLQYQYINTLAPSAQTLLVPGNAPFILPAIPR